MNARFILVAILVQTGLCWSCLEFKGREGLLLPLLSGSMPGAAAAGNGSPGSESDGAGGAGTTATGSGTPGLTVSTNSVSVTEGSGTGAYVIKLASAPAGNVDVEINFGADFEIKVDAGSFSAVSPVIVTFTPAGFNTGHTVTIRALSNLILADSRNRTITHDLSSTDTDYNYSAVAAESVSAAIADATPLSAGWWNSAYSKRRKVVFGAAHAGLTADHTITLALDTTGAMAGGQDVRVVWQPGSGAAQELHRVGYNWNQASTRIDLKLLSSVPAGQNTDPDGNYFIYYNNAAPATALENEANVYLFADFFARTAGTAIGNGWQEWRQGSYNPDICLLQGGLAWPGDCSPAVGYNSARYVSFGQGMYFRGGDPDDLPAGNINSEMESGVERQISGATMATAQSINLPFRFEFDWYVAERNTSKWYETNYFFGVSLGDLADPQHRDYLDYQGQPWLGINLVMGQGHGASPDTTGGSAATWNPYRMQFNRLNGAAWRHDNPVNFTNYGSGYGNESATLAMKLDVDPLSYRYALSINGAAQFTNQSFLHNVDIKHIRFFEHTYMSDQPPPGVGMIRLYYPHDGSLETEETY